MSTFRSIPSGASLPSPVSPAGSPASGPVPPWTVDTLKPLLEELLAIRTTLHQVEHQFAKHLGSVSPTFEASAHNLLHYLALRRHDIRDLQERLAALGLSSLGRTESHVAAAIDAVLHIIHHLTDREWSPATYPQRSVGFADGKALLRTHTEALLGPSPAKRSVRIMVTMPREAAYDYPLVRQLVANGMDCMRVNCAHDDAAAWEGMVANLRRATQEVGRECRILMDLAGPKLRTGPIDPSTQITKWRPGRDLSGRVTAPTRVWLAPAEQPVPPPEPCAGSLRVPQAWLRAVREGDRIRCNDLRGKTRTFALSGLVGAGRWGTGEQTVYLAAAHHLDLRHIPAEGSRCHHTTAVVEPPHPAEHFIVLAPGDELILTRAPKPGRPARRSPRGTVLRPASIACTMPAVFADVRAKEPIWFDDGRIGGVIESVTADALRVRITVANPAGSKLRADKGINFPESGLRLPGLTDKDIADLDFVIRHADLVGLSFVKRPDDVAALQGRLTRLGADHLGIVLKIETRTGFEQLPALLLSAMRSPRVGVMIARGDLAVECGWERLAEVQEEILWMCEAAHVPVIWATQVLESLAKTGVPSRAEITDAAMGERAECVMLNKGPHLPAAVRSLDDILRRMEAHQSKKTPRLRALRVSTMTTP